MRNHNKRWVKQDDEHLIEYWGYKTLIGFCRDLGRTELSVIKRAKILKLGSPRSTEYLTRTEVGKLLGTDYHTLSRIKNLKFTKKKFKFKSFFVIKIEDLMKWLEANPDKYNARNIVPYSLGYEPEWLVEKRKLDPDSKAHRKWTYRDDVNLTNMFKGGISLEDIAVELKRSKKACTRRLYRVGLKKGNGNLSVPWTKEEDEMLKDLLYNSGKTLDGIAESIGRSKNSIKTRIARKLNTSYSEVRGICSPRIDERVSIYVQNDFVV